MMHTYDYHILRWYLLIAVNVVVDSASLGGDCLQQSGIMVRPKPKRVYSTVKLQRVSIDIIKQELCNAKHCTMTIIIIPWLQVEFFCWLLRQPQVGCQ